MSLVDQRVKETTELRSFLHLIRQRLSAENIILSRFLKDCLVSLLFSRQGLGMSRDASFLQEDFLQSRARTPPSDGTLREKIQRSTLRIIENQNHYKTLLKQSVLKGSKAVSQTIHRFFEVMLPIKERSCKEEKQK